MVDNFPIVHKCLEKSQKKNDHYRNRRDSGSVLDDKRQPTHPDHTVPECRGAREWDRGQCRGTNSGRRGGPGDVRFWFRFLMFQ